jgi:predicted transcriptional regulator of viral defense system
MIFETDLFSAPGKIPIIFYIHACFAYNISMDVKKEQKPIEKLREILIAQNGILLTSDLAKHGILRTYLSILEAAGEIQKVSRGVYSAAETITDEMAGLQSRYKRAFFSHETALYLWELTDRTPLFYSVTVPTGYNATPLKASGAKVYFVKQDLFPLGLTTMRSLHGNDIRASNLERTIIDILRNRNQIDVQYINEALKRYVSKKEGNIDLLYNFAMQFRIQKFVRTYMEILL